MVNYWIFEEIAFMVLLMEACRKKHQSMSGYYNGEIHVNWPEYKQYNHIGKLIKRSGQATRRKYQAYTERHLNINMLKAVDKEVGRLKTLPLDLTLIL